MFSTHMDPLLLLKESELVKSSMLSSSPMLFLVNVACPGMTARKLNAEGEVCLVLDRRAKTGNLSGGPMWSVHVRQRSQSTKIGPVKDFSVLFLNWERRGKGVDVKIWVSVMMHGVGKGAAGLLKIFITFSGRHASLVYCTKKIKYLKKRRIHTD